MSQYHGMSAHFCNNPILMDLSFDGNLSLRMLRIGALVRVIDQGGSVKSSCEVSQPLPSAAAVRFEFSRIARAAYPTVAFALHSTSPVRTLPTLSLEATPFVTWVDDTGKLQRTDGRSYFTSLLPGGLSDIERAGSPVIASVLVGKAALLSRKPAGEVLHPGATHVLTFTSEATSIAVSLSGASANVSLGTLTMQKYGLGVATVAPTGKTDGSPARLMVNSVSGRLMYHCEPTGTPFHFIFLNGFGVPESFTCFSSYEVGYSVEKESFMRVSDRSMTAVNEKFAGVSQPQRTLKLSSGPLEKAWSEWFASEFLATPRAVLFIPELNQWVPVTISGDANASAWKSSGTAITSIEFEVELARSGSGLKAHFLG